MNNIRLVTIISSKRRSKMSNNLVSQDDYLNKSEINSNNYIISEVNSVDLLDEYFNYMLLVIICVLFLTQPHFNITCYYIITYFDVKLHVYR